MAGISTILGNNQTFPGTSGDDTVTAKSNDTVSGGDGNDSLSYTGTNDTINGNAGNDTIESASFSAGSDSLFGGQGDDLIYAYASSSLLSGDLGNDTLSIYGNFDTLSGALGNDVIYTYDRDSRGLTLLGGQGDDSIYTYSASSLVSGDIGNDTIQANGSFDTVLGGDGNDSIAIYNGTDSAFVKDDTINGNLGNDLIYTSEVEDSSIRGGQGDDRISTYQSYANKIYGDLGDDFIFVNDQVYNSSETVVGSNFINGGQGEDTIVAVSTLNDTIHGGQDDDVLVLGSSGFDDSIGSFNSVLFGDIGNDNLIADDSGYGIDGIYDQTAQDTLVGGDGNDRLFSIGNSNVIMTGDGTGSTDPGADLFYVQGFGLADSSGGAEHESTVTDFVSGVDHLSFDSISGTSANFTATAAEVSNVFAAGSAAAAVKTSETLYVFVAGATDGYLFYDGDASVHGGENTFNAEITLTGKNDISDVTFNDIVSVTQSGIPGLNEL